MLDHLTHAHQPDLEHKDIVEGLVALSISSNGHITVSTRPQDPGVPDNSGASVIPPPAVPAPTVLPALHVPVALAVPVGRPRVVSSPSTRSPRIISISVQDKAVDSESISINITIRPRSQSASASPLPPPPSSTISGISELSSSSSSALPPPSTVRCSGWAKSKGRRCDNPVARMPLSYIHPDDIRPEEGDIPHFCHIKGHDVVREHFYPPKAGGTKVKFAYWIPDYLEKSTQAALRVKMAEPPSESDEPGYVYAYEVRDPSCQDPQKLCLKVGCTVDLPKRMNQWQKQCPLKEHILRGHWPGGLQDGPQDGAEDEHVASANADPPIIGPKGPLCHRVERLAHLELADLVVNKQYLDPDFTLWQKSDTPSRPKIAPRSSAGKMNFPRHQCSGCGTVHREIFTLTRVDDGIYKGKEWDSIVKPIIGKWGAFVKMHVRDE